MFKNEENEKLKTEIKNYQSQLEIETLKYRQLQEQFEHKNNELADLVAQVFLSFRRITEIAERNDYEHPEQKMRQIYEFAQEQKNYYAQLTLGTSYTKNRTTTTYQSNK